MAIFAADFFACLTGVRVFVLAFAGATGTFLGAAAALPFRFAFGVLGVTFEVGSECFKLAFVAVPEDTSLLIASFARVTAAIAS